VAVIRTDVSEDRIASIFRVNEYEQVQSETVSSCRRLYRRGNLKSYIELYRLVSANFASLGVVYNIRYLNTKGSHINTKYAFFSTY
jgi:hypothetical protein